MPLATPNRLAEAWRQHHEIDGSTGEGGARGRGRGRALMATAAAARDRTEILISGFGGQGVIRMGQILGYCAIDQGRRVTMLKSHGTETRGGYVRAQVVIATDYVDSPVVENADIFVAFSAPAYRKFYDCCRGLVLYDPDAVGEVRGDEPERHVAVPAGALAKERFGNVLFANMIMLGALSRLAGMDLEAMRRAMLRAMPRFHEQNSAALDLGWGLDTVLRAGERARPAAAAPAAGDRPWHRVWPAHVPRSLVYPEVPAWRILERNLERFSDRVALRVLDHETGAEEDAVTYADLWEAARAFAGGLRRLGVGRGDRVALCLPNGVPLAVALHGTWISGATAVALSPALTERELGALLSDATPRVLVAAPARAALAARLDMRLVAVAEAGDRLPPDTLAFAGLTRRDAEGVAPAAVDPSEDVALILYTGGTTGAPKGAMLTHRNLVANTIQFAEWYRFEPGAETCIGALPMSHSGGMAGALNVPLYAGATILVFRRFNPATIGRAVERFRATRLFGVPTMYVALMNDAASRRADYSSLRACRTSAAPLPASVKAAFDALVGHEVLVEGYGLTESSPLTHANPPERARPGSIGIPLPDTDARVVDLESGADVPPGEAGELLIRGPQVMRGYWQRPEETWLALAGDWLRTGDVARMDADGYFFVVDRRKDQINTAGFKVWPREVEDVLYGHPAVRLVAVVGQPDAYRGEVVKACVVLKEEHRGRVSAEDLLAFCREGLAGYKVPRVVEFRDELPMSPAGKTLRRKLRGEGG